MFKPSVAAATLLALVALSGCGMAAPGATTAQGPATSRVAASNFSHMEQTYTYRLGSKAAKKFMAAAADVQARYKARGTKCELIEDGGLLGTTIKVALEGTMEDVMALRQELDALYKSLK